MELNQNRWCSDKIKSTKFIKWKNAQLEDLAKRYEIGIIYLQPPVHLITDNKSSPTKDNQKGKNEDEYDDEEDEDEKEHKNAV